MGEVKECPDPQMVNLVLSFKEPKPDGTAGEEFLLYFSRFWFSKYIFTAP